MCVCMCVCVCTSHTGALLLPRQDLVAHFLTAHPQVKALKYELIAQFADHMITDVDVYSSKSHIGRAAVMLARQAAGLPKPRLIFTQHADVQASSVSVVSARAYSCRDPVML